MRNQPPLPAIVRLSALALMVGVVACSQDAIIASDAADDLVLVTASAKKGGGSTLDPVFEPQRFESRATSRDGRLLQCQVNSYEDLDGNDFRMVAPDGTYRKEHIQEHNGFVMIVDRSAGHVVTHLGRTQWQADIWFDETTNRTISGNSRAQGVVFPVAPGLRGDLGDEVRTMTENVLDWFTRGEALPGAWRFDEDGNIEDVPRTAGFPVDLLHDPLGIIPIGPSELLGSVGRAVATINDILAAYAEYNGGELLEGTDCDAHWTGDIASPTGIRRNTIAFRRTWPKQLNELFQ